MIWKYSRYNAISIEGEHHRNITIMQGRISILMMFFIVAYSLVMLRLVDLTIVQGEVRLPNIEKTQNQDIKEIAPRRGDIYDRNGFLLATTLKTPSLFVDPSLVTDADALLDNLLKVIPDIDKNKLYKTLHAKNRFGWIARNITPAQQQEILNIGDPSLGFEYEYKRIYPQGQLFSHLLGYTNRDGLGLAGIERSYNDILSAGKDIYLALDLRLQHVLRRELSTAINDFNAIAGAGAIIDAQTGEVLAGVSLPDFNLNNASKANKSQMFNRLTLGVYELGSIFKIFSTAAMLDLFNIDMGYKFDARKPIHIGRFTINDYHAQKRILTLPEVFMHSSNIGSALIGQMVGGKNLRKFYSDLGLLDPMNIDIREVGRPLVPSIWRKSTTLTASYGHGLATTPLQMSTAVASIINGGILVSPKLIKSNEIVQNQVRVISEETSDKMRKLLRLVVTKGTGKNADVKGYSVGGKTGTAEKSVNGRYDRKKLISSFVGAFPMDNPKYVLMVMVDEPKPNKNSYGYATAGWVAAPAVARIVTSMASILGIPADKYDPAKDISLELFPYLHDEKGGKKLVSY